MGELDEAVYCHDVDTHLPSAVRSSHDLRGQILIQAALSRPLVLGDSQGLNNPAFRALVTRGGLDVLLRRGDLRIARRDTVRSFREIRDAHADSRKVDNVPDPSYAEWLDAATAEMVVPYPADIVETRFKEGMLARLRDELARAGRAGPAFVRTVEDTLDWVAGQPVLYRRDLVRRDAELRTDADHEVVEALGVVNLAANDAYVRSLPQALGAALVGPRAQALADVPLALHRSHQVVLPPALLSPLAWSRLDVRTLLHILDLPARRAAVAALTAARLGQSADPARLIPLVAELAEQVDLVFANAFRHDDEVRAALRYADVRCRIAALEDTQTGATGAQLDVFEGDARRADHFDIVSMSIPVSHVRSALWVASTDTPAAPHTRAITPADVT